MGESSSTVEQRKHNLCVFAKCSARPPSSVELLQAHVGAGGAAGGEGK